MEYYQIRKRQRINSVETLSSDPYFTGDKVVQIGLSRPELILIMRSNGCVEQILPYVNGCTDKMDITEVIDSSFAETGWVDLDKIHTMLDLYGMDGEKEALMQRI